ncbi:tetratricopeptide repeat protein [Kribbella speibonae]|uniref:Tetratricopeptide repeat protein n=1 Tax=Kribbella speibonae TaxID=1572660 RepID=A0A4R0JC14_9ACTN|nr:tetratricopeptide repeat protein [Kribbella speibonae]TCC16508.1 hypothetical protein E0H58_39205 [Kribbella speibonae]TCC41968.1 hypothetical protein E0H92_10130 [Kribbella speibonae]
MPTSPMKPEDTDADEEAEAARHSKVIELIRQGRFEAARDWVESEAYDRGDNPRAERMRLLALIARAEGDPAQSLAHMNEGRVSAPDYPRLVSDFIDLLVELRRFRQALDLIAELDASRSDDVLVRASCGHFYKRLGLSAHAYLAYRGAYKETLRKVSCRIRAGWFETFVARAVKREDESIGTWRRWLAPSMLFDDLPLSGFDSSQVRANVEWLNWRRLTVSGLSGRLDRLFRWAWRLIYIPISAALAFHVSGRILMNPGVVEQIFVAAASLAVAAATADMIWRCHWWMARENVALAVGIVTTLTIGGILVAARTYYSAFTAPWLTLFGLSLAFGSASLAVACASLAAPQWHQALRLGELRRDEPHAWIVDTLLDVIYGVGREGWRSNAWDRKYYVQLIEAAARGLHGDFRHSVPALDGESEKWVAQRSAGVAASLRAIKCELIAPTINSATVINKSLVRYIIALASGNLRQLPWVSPPPPPTPLGLRGRIWRTGKLSIIAILPLTSVIILNYTVGLPEIAQPWLLGVSVVWLVTSILFILDPQLREKLDAMNLFITILRKERGEAKTEEQATIGSVK